MDVSMLSRWFPFLTSRACCEACGNLKAAFLVAVCFLTLCTAVTIYFAEEVPLVAKPQHHISDSAPLLNGAQRPRVGLSDMHSEKPIDDHVNGISLQVGNEGTAETSMHQSLKPEEQNQVYHDGPGAVLVNLLTSLRHLPPGMHSVLLVMALCWLSWFPFFLFDTDWMGREVYHGDPKGNETYQKAAYESGVREGAFGLLINSVVLGISSFLIEPMCQRIGARLVWAVSNFIIFVCMAGTAVISLFSSGKYSDGIQHVIVVNGTNKVAALVIFAVLGFPLAITYSVPFSVTAELTSDSGGGQGLAIGVLNLAIVIPQMIVSLGAGPWDALFGGGNIPAFVLASIFAFAAGTTAILKLPKLSGGSYNSPGIHGFG